MTPQTTDLTLIDDITELKALKADSYDIIENAKNAIEESHANIRALNTRISQITLSQDIEQVPVELEVLSIKEQN